MNVDGALNVAGMSLEILAVVAGVIASDAGKLLRERLASLGAQAKSWYYRFSWAILLLAVGMIGASELYESLFSSFLLGSRVLLIGGIVLLVFAIIDLRGHVSKWIASKLPDNEPEVGVFLGWAGGVFGLGVALQLFAVATPWW